MKNHKGQIICDSSVIIDTKQKRVQIPFVVDEILDIQPGDKFRWFVERNKNGWLKISAIYIGKSDVASYKYPKLPKKKEKEDGKGV